MVVLKTPLSQEPSPADIRPLHVLKQTLELLKRKWKENHDYIGYALPQFKSLRQDLTVCELLHNVPYPADIRAGAAYQEQLLSPRV